MSLLTKRRGRPGQRAYGGGGFSSRSTGSYAVPKVSAGATYAAPIASVTINRSLLVPMNIDIDPTVYTVRTREKEQIKSLNDDFVTLIDKVRRLEQQNKMLETKWVLLQQQTAPSSQVEPMLQAYVAKLQRQLAALDSDTHRLEAERTLTLNSVEDNRSKYESEISKRNAAESEFVSLKKETDISYLTIVGLEDNVSSISGEINFLKAVHDAELRELLESLKETSVVVEMDNSRRLNMENTIAEVKVQYDDVFKQSCEDAEVWYKSKFDEVAAEANRYNNELRSTKAEMSELSQMIRRLQSEIQAVKAQNANLEGQTAAAEQRGEAAVRDARARVRDLEVALMRAKQDMARQVREYQELMNVKLALDIEISTYMKLLEGEEEKSYLANYTVEQLGNRPIAVPETNHVKRRQCAILIKTVEVHDDSYV